MARKIEIPRYKCTDKIVDGKVKITFKSDKRGVWCLWRHVAPYIKEAGRTERAANKSKHVQQAKHATCPKCKRKFSFEQVFCPECCES